MASRPEDANDPRLRYPNLRSAGRELATALGDWRQRSNTIVLGVVSGGLPVAHEVAKGLGQPLDLIVRRTLLVPQGPGSELSAASVAGVLILPEELQQCPPVPSKPLDYFLSDAIGALDQRQRLCRGNRPARNLDGQNVIVVDCGIRSGLTMRSAIAAVRATNPSHIVGAVPVSSVEGCASVSAMVDEFVCLAQPEPFGHAGMWYDDFTRVTDEEIHALLRD